jgi:hypothetical protein
MARRLFRPVLCFFLVWTGNTSAQSCHSIVADRHMGPFAGGETAIALNGAVFQIEGRFLKAKYGPESKPPSRALGLCYRSLKTLLLDFPAVHMLSVLQHEYFGHGYKARELGLSHIGFQFDAPFPYGRGNASTRLDGEFLGLTPHGQSALFYSGSQATSMIANSLRLKFVKNRSMNYQEALLYLNAFADLTAYVLTTDLQSAEGGNDITNFIRVTYPGESAEEKLKKLKRSAVMNFLSPFPYYSIYAFFKSYYWSGTAHTSLPMIPFSGFDYLPSFRFGLSPHGYELILENYIRTAGHAARLYFRYGEPRIHENWGAGVDVTGLFKSRALSLDGDVHFWKQPPLLLDGADHAGGHASFGWAAVLTATISPFMRRNIHFLAQAGYKTGGFLEGENLSKDFIIRAGLSFLEIR